MRKVRDVICLSAKGQGKRFFRTSKSKLIKFRSAKARKRSGSSKPNFGSLSILMYGTFFVLSMCVLGIFLLPYVSGESSSYTIENNAWMYVRIVAFSLLVASSLAGFFAELMIKSFSERLRGQVFDLECGSVNSVSALGVVSIIMGLFNPIYPHADWTSTIGISGLISLLFLPAMKLFVSAFRLWMRDQYGSKKSESTVTLRFSQ